jgi:hypothetical protein
MLKEILGRIVLLGLGALMVVLIVTHPIAFIFVAAPIGFAFIGNALCSGK